ncbi:hypothetical protein PIROE2DRAFT_21104 [Piromyces sp. E2]|nr:hypothetical protein PIROE2DRAFT_21104 [Piromyces sp. E2]|eukprot:OUM60316.1 hypothetical protein PIROE2DRAFT_21104 [Piromyces sp. E2]
MTIINNRKHKNKLSKKNSISINENSNANINNNNINISNSNSTNNTISKIEIKDELSDTYSFNDFLEESDVENDSLDINIKRSLAKTFSTSKPKNNKNEDANVNEAYIKQIDTKELSSNDSIRNKLFAFPNIKVQHHNNYSNDLSPSQFSIIAFFLFENFATTIEFVNN